jgi:hypothetical protein
MRLGLGLLVPLAAACSIDESGQQPTADSGSDVLLITDTGTKDASIDATPDVGHDAVVDVTVDAPPPCDVNAPFSGAVDLAGGVNTGSWEDSPSLTSDELTLFFMRIDGTGHLALNYATRTSTSMSFATTKAVDTISNSSTEDTAPFVVDGFGTIYMSSLRNGNIAYHLFQVTGTGTPNGWNNVNALSMLNANDPATDTQLWIDALGGAWFTSNRAGTYDLYAAASTTSSPTAYAALNTITADEEHPVLSQDGLQLYYASNAAGHFQIYVATRTSTSGTFGGATELPAFDYSFSNNKPGWLSPDGCRMYYSSDRAGGQGNWDIWMASR